jgi:hypothetical protein
MKIPVTPLFKVCSEALSSRSLALDRGSKSLQSVNGLGNELQNIQCFSEKSTQHLESMHPRRILEYPEFLCGCA